MGAELDLVGPVERVAPTLLGAVLSHAGVSVRITEVEAYAGQGQDPASHSHRGPTPRTAPMFGPVGHAYVYLSYGIHRCLNVVAHPPGGSGAVLVRGGEVVAGLELARARRPRVADRHLARGPGCLCAVLDVGLDLTGADLSRGPLHLALGPPMPWGGSTPRAADDTPGPNPPLASTQPPFRSGVRIGITKAADRPWRFWVDGAPGVSRHPPVPRTE